MTARESVQYTFAFTQPEFTPCDYFGTPEVHTALLKHFKVTDDDALMDCLGTDIRYIDPPYIGPPLPKHPDGSQIDIWGVTKRPMPNEYGDYMESVGLPYAEWKTTADAENFSWPDPEWFDYEAISVMCERYPDKAIAAGRYGVQDFINGAAFGRGVERVLIDIAEENPVFLYIMEKRHRFSLEVYDRVLTAGKGRIDLVLCGDDFGTQRSCLISPQKFSRLFAGKKKEFFDMVHSHGAKVSHHCCGSSIELIPLFIDVGMDALQTIQPQATGMNPYELKQNYHGRLVLHGAVDVQGWLQKAKEHEIKTEINNLIDVVGANGGYILGPCHNIQPDTPIENVIALYRAVAERRNGHKG